MVRSRAREGRQLTAKSSMPGFAGSCPWAILKRAYSCVFHISIDVDTMQARRHAGFIWGGSLRPLTFSRSSLLSLPLICSISMVAFSNCVETIVMMSFLGQHRSCSAECTGSSRDLTNRIDVLGMICWEPSSTLVQFGELAPCHRGCFAREPAACRRAFRRGPGDDTAGLRCTALRGCHLLDFPAWTRRPWFTCTTRQEGETAASSTSHAFGFNVITELGRQHQQGLLYDV